MDRSNRSFAIAWRVTLWLVGLLVALMTGMLSGYLVASAVYLGSRAYARMRRLGAAPPRQVGPDGTR